MTDDKRLEKLQARAAEAHVQAMESALDLFGVFDFPGTPRDIYGEVDGLQPVPPGGIPPYYWNNRGRGEVLPVYTTWLQLKYLRDRSRRLCRENEFAVCAIENRKNYVVGDGFTYRATGERDDLNEPAQKLIDTWAAAIELAEYEIDAMERLDMDGEFFLRFFYRQSGLLELRFVEPEHIKDIAGDPWSPRDSFGIVTDIDDVENVHWYQVIEQPWNNDTPTKVKADEIMHVKLNVPRNAKRGLPTFYPVEGNLRRANDLLASMATMAKTRAKIALIRKLLNATGSAASSMVNSLKAGSVTDSMTGQSSTLERMPWGSILTSTGNVEYEMPGANVDAGGFVEVLQAELRGIAARLNMPEWMLTADASNANLASSLVAEAPSTKQFRRLQRMLCRRFGESRNPKNTSVVWRQVEYAVRLGLLDPATLQEVKIQCEGPSLVVRDKGEEAETNKVYLEMGIKSKSTISQELGLDKQQEEANFARENQAKVENISSTAPGAVRQQESVQDRKPGELTEDGGYHEPEAEPNMDEFIYNKFKAMYGDQDEPDRSTGYILKNGQPIKMGREFRDSDHREALPTRAARERWGWKSNDRPAPGQAVSIDTSNPNISNIRFNGDALGELLHKTGAARTHVAKDHISFEYSHPLTSRQKRVIRDFVNDRKPGEVVFSRRMPEKDVEGQTTPTFRHKVLPWHQVDDYLNGTQESVKKVTETVDDAGHAHSPMHGRLVQPEFGPEFPMLMDPKAKQEFVNRKTASLQQDYVQAAQSHAANMQKLQQAAYINETGEAPDPAELDKLNKDAEKSMADVRKAWDAFQTSSQEGKELASGPTQMTADDLDRTLTSGPFHIISAGRNGNNPRHEGIDPKEFAERHKQMGEDLTKGGYKYVELKGKYGGLEEPSYMVVAPEDHAHVIRTLGYKYGQESVIHSHKGQNALAFVTGPASNTAHRGTGFQYLPDADDNYSEYTDPAGKKVKFALNLNFGESHPVEESVKEAVAPMSGKSGFTASDFHDMLHSYLPPKESVDETHDPNDVVKFYHDLSNTLKARTGHTLAEALYDHKHGPLHTNAGEAVIAALHGGPYEGPIKGGWDSRKVNKHGVTIGADSKMTADPEYKNRRLKLDTGTINDMQNKTAKTGAFPVLVGFNPGHSDKGGMIVAHKGAVNFPTRDTPDLHQKVAKGDAAILAKFGDVGDFLKDPAAVASAQEQFKKLANTVKPKHLSTALNEFQHQQAVNYFRRLQGLANRGDKTAASKLQEFGLTDSN